MATVKKKIGGKQGPRAGMKDKGGKKRIMKQTETKNWGGHWFKIKTKLNTKTRVGKIKSTSRKGPIKKAVLKGTVKAMDTYRKTKKVTPGLKRTKVKPRK